MPGSAGTRGNRERGRGRESESERIELWLAVVDRNRGGKEGGEGEGDGREAEGRFGTAMNISLAHLFMQYFALAGLRLLPLSAGSVAASSLPLARRYSLR